MCPPLVRLTLKFIPRLPYLEEHPFVPYKFSDARKSDFRLLMHSFVQCPFPIFQSLIAGCDLSNPFSQKVVKNIAYLYSSLLLNYKVLHLICLSPQHLQT